MPLQRMPVKFTTLFERSKPIIAMIHTGPSPGVPGFICVDSAVERAVAEAEVYQRSGVDGIIIENMRDFPCVPEREMGPEVAAFMTRVAYAVKRRLRYIPVGIQVLFHASKTALAVAQAANCDFIRAEAWTHAHVADKGIAEANAGSVIRYRHQIGADRIPVFADIKKKHASHAWTADLSLSDIARSMELHRADAIIVTGIHTGSLPEPEDLHSVRAETGLPILVGSGVTAQNLGRLFPLADGFIIGSAFKEGGLWHAPVSEKHVDEILAIAEHARAVHPAKLTHL